MTQWQKILDELRQTEHLKDMKKIKLFTGEFTTYSKQKTGKGPALKQNTTTSMEAQDVLFVKK